MIEAEALSKVFHVHRRGSDLRSVLASLFHRRYEPVVALANASFRIDDAERVGILGPNGAGKTTLMKLLSGLLHPSAGVLHVDGYTPNHRAPSFLRRIGMIMGNKGQLIWDLPPIDTFEMIRVIFGVSKIEYQRILAELIELLSLSAIMAKPTRQLSLGERMRCEAAAALIHRPRVLFMDEPTLGLDIAMQASLRQFIAEYNQRYDATILLTSHYMADIQTLCPRVMIVDQGAMLYDGDWRNFIAMQRPEKIISFTLGHEVQADHLARYGQWARRDNRLEIRVPRERAGELLRNLMSQYPDLDLTIEDPPLEDVLRQVFSRTTDICVEATAC